ncbi:hypothetical protein MAUB1S_09682 [Mycolicibacterium aubagnense]
MRSPSASDGENIGEAGMSAAWTSEELDVLKLLAAKGLTASQIAARLGNGRSRNAVIGKMERDKIVLANARSRLHRPAKMAKPKPARAKLPSRRSRFGGATSPVAAPVASAPIVKAPANLPATLPMTFLDAMFAGRCLHFVGDPYGVDGPMMPVCGAERAFDDTGQTRFCTRHHQSCHRRGEDEE